jgi:hypothetical protein
MQTHEVVQAGSSHGCGEVAVRWGVQSHAQQGLLSFACILDPRPQVSGYRQSACFARHLK